MVKLDRSVKEVKDIKQTLIQRIITLESGLNKCMQKIDLGHTGKRTQSVMEETHDNFSSSIFRNKSQISEEKEVKRGGKNKSMNSPNKKSFMNHGKEKTIHKIITMPNSPIISENVARK